MQDYNPAKVAEQITELIQKEYKELKNLNVMILGKTGVGKSTLVNNMFSEKLAETGVGKPVTDKIHQQTGLSAYDFRYAGTRAGRGKCR